MLEPRHERDLLEQRVGPDSCRRFRRHDLDGDQSAERAVRREVHGAHGALAELGEDLISVGDRAPEVDLVGAAVVGHEQVVERDAEHLEHALPCLRRRERMSTVDDVRPMPAREAEADRPVILTQPAGGEQCGESLESQAIAHRALYDSTRVRPIPSGTSASRSVRRAVRRRRV
jgi:hypothetical protein